jgi:hypothetical protein
VAAAAAAAGIEAGLVHQYGCQQLLQRRQCSGSKAQLLVQANALSLIIAAAGLHLQLRMFAAVTSHLQQ